MTPQQWEQWKERNWSWYGPVVAAPFVLLVVAAYTAFWLPYVVIAILLSRLQKPGKL